MNINSMVRELHEQAIIGDGHCGILIPISKGKVNLRVTHKRVL